MVGSSSNARIKCYVILQGLERSLADNLSRNFEISSTTFLSKDEQNKALKRLREDEDDPNIQPDELDNEELLPYLDLGDLVSIMNRHVKSVKNASPEHVRAATKIILEREILTIRKRVMHPVRPLEVDDLPNLLYMAQQIQKIAPSLIWDPLAISLRRQSKEGPLLDITIPSYWAEESPVIHNLPPAEFDDTGFIGRTKERKDLKRLLESDHRVVTVVGGAGIGKTALSLRVCNDILDEEKPTFDRMVWVTLKTRHLTPEGIKEIYNAIDSLGALIDTILRILRLDNTANWKGIIEQLKASKTLLVIDNLETIGEEIREFLLEVPAGSKILLTSRVGLGEIEIRYELGDFNPKDALALFRTVVTVHNCITLKNLKQDAASRYVQKLNCNPLLIKWFVLAVGKAADPETLLTPEILQEPLNFFYEKIYESLGSLPKQILSILLSARRELSKAQLQELSVSQQIHLLKAMQDLVRSSMVERVVLSDGTMVYRVVGLVYEFLSRNYPPPDPLVRLVRQKIKDWQVEQDKSFVESTAYRYGRQVLHVEKADDRIAAQHLLRAQKASWLGDAETASEALKIAEQLTPTWWEVYRVKAQILENQNKPIYEVEEAYEQSIRIQANDVNRYYYATYLLRQNEYERVLEQINEATTYDEAIQSTFQSLKGLALMRMGKVDDAIIELENVWHSRPDKIPRKVGLAQGTQLADAYRRQCAQMLDIDRHDEAFACACRATRTINEVSKDYGWDRFLVTAAIDIVIAIIHHTEIIGDRGQEIVDTTNKWDRDGQFRRHITRLPKTLDYFKKNPIWANISPVSMRNCKIWVT